MHHVLGQDLATEHLMAALRADRVHHACLFAGPVGVGKFTMALALAKLLLCPNTAIDPGGHPAACGSCRSCELFDRESHPDLHVVRKELASVSSVAELRRRKQMNIPIDLLREHVVGGTTSDGKYHEPAASKTPLLNHQKVFIIDEAELLDENGQSALLKTLEEPPSGTFLILVAARQERLLPTVRSRCQRVAFVPLPEPVICRWLAEHAGHLDQQQRQWIAAFAEGSLGQAELAVTYELHRWARTVQPAIEQMKAGKLDWTLGRQMAAMINEFASEWVSRHPGASKEAANKRAVGMMWSLIAHDARRRIHEMAAGCATADPQQADQLFGPWLEVMDALSEAKQKIDSNVNIGLVCDHLVLALDRSLCPSGC